MTVSAVSPWRTAFRRDRFLPSSVTGPVLRRALRRLASSCRNEVIRSPVSKWVRVVVSRLDSSLRSKIGAVPARVGLELVPGWALNRMRLLP